jgi:hypothetical protein
MGARSSIVVEALCYKLEGCGIETGWSECFLFLIYLIHLAALGSGIYSACNRNENQKQKYRYFWGVERGRCVGLTTLPSSVSRLSRQCGILNISQAYKSPQPATGVVLFFYFHYYYYYYYYYHHYWEIWVGFQVGSRYFSLLYSIHTD